MTRRRIDTAPGIIQFILRLFALANTLVLFGLLCYTSANWHVASHFTYIATIIALFIDTSECVSLADKTRRITWFQRFHNGWIIAFDLFAFAFFFAGFFDWFSHILTSSEYDEIRDGNDPTKADVRGWRSDSAEMMGRIILPELCWHFIFLMINCIAICVRRKRSKRTVDTAHQTAVRERADSEELAEYQLQVIAVKEASKIPASYFAPSSKPAAAAVPSPQLKLNLVASI